MIFQWDEGTIWSSYPEELSEKKKRRIGEKSAIFYRDNARAMCCKIDTPEIGKGEMGSFVAPAPTISILFSKIIISLK